MVVSFADEAAVILFKLNACLLSFLDLLYLQLTFLVTLRFDELSNRI